MPSVAVLAGGLPRETLGAPRGHALLCMTLIETKVPKESGSVVSWAQKLDTSQFGDW